MRRQSHLLQCASVVSVLVLSGCEAGSSAPGAGAGEVQAEATGDDEDPVQKRITMAETAWLTVSKDGLVQTTFIDADGRYRDYRGGELLFSGQWRESPEDELCFSPDAGEGECWEFSSPEKDGTMRVTAQDGREVILKRVAYSPPAEANDDDSADNS